MEELDLFSRMNAIGEVQAYTSVLGVDEEYATMISEHKTWLRSIRHERPSTRRKFMIGVYIRYFNQTKYEDYLNYHKKQFESTINLCPIDIIFFGNEFFIIRKFYTVSHDFAVCREAGYEFTNKGFRSWIHIEAIPQTNSATAVYVFSLMS